MLSSQHVICRPAAVSGQFYPADPVRLNAMLDQLLASANELPARPLKAVIVPHAGYLFSGPVAASLYRMLEPLSPRIERVVLLGPSHHVGFHGLASSPADCFSTPLGDVMLDRQTLDAIADLPQVSELVQAHAREHSLEVQLPFLQRVLASFRLVPLVVGESSPVEVAEVLERLWGDDETLIVISSDLSHFHSYETAVERDRRTSQAIVELDSERIDYGDACGRNPVNGLLRAARSHGLTCELVDLRNSGDTAGSRDRVVGYGSYRLFADV